MSRRFVYAATLTVGSLFVFACGLVERATPAPSTVAVTIMAPTDAPPAENAAPAGAPAAAPANPAAVTITDAQATQYAIEALKSNPNALPVPVENPRISFTRESINLAADTRGARLEVEGTPQVANERITFKVTSLKLSGIEVPFYHNEVEDAINSIFSGVLAGQRIQSVELGDGVLTVIPIG
jgi:hypothetical protein